VDQTCHFWCSSENFQSIFDGPEGWDSFPRWDFEQEQDGIPFPETFKPNYIQKAFFELIKGMKFHENWTKKKNWQHCQQFFFGNN